MNAAEVGFRNPIVGGETLELGGTALSVFLFLPNDFDSRWQDRDNIVDGEFKPSAPTCDHEEDTTSISMVPPESAGHHVRSPDG